MKRFISYLLSFCLSISMVFCVSEAGAVFLLISPGAAAQGAGEAQVAKATDAYASYFNPAGLSFINRDEVVLQHANWLPNLADDIYFDFIGFNKHIASGTLGGHLIYMNLGTQQQTNSAGDELGTFRSYMAALAMGYSTTLNPHSSIGFNFKVFHQRLADTAVEGEGSVGGSDEGSSTDIAFDIGYLLKFGKAKKHNFGLAIQNIGPPIDFVDAEQADPAPTNMKIGFDFLVHSTENTKINVLFDMNKLLVASYQAMDWDGNGYINGSKADPNADPSGFSSDEQAHKDEWYKGVFNAWLDDWYYGGDYDESFPEGLSGKGIINNFWYIQDEEGDFDDGFADGRIGGYKEVSWTHVMLNPTDDPILSDIWRAKASNVTISSDHSSLVYAPNYSGFCEESYESFTHLDINSEPVYIDNSGTGSMCYDIKGQQYQPGLVDSNDPNANPYEANQNAGYGDVNDNNIIDGDEVGHYWIDMPNDGFAVVDVFDANCDPLSNYDCTASALIYDLNGDGTCDTNEIDCAPIGVLTNGLDLNDANIEPGNVTRLDLKYDRIDDAEHSGEYAFNDSEYGRHNPYGYEEKGSGDDRSFQDELEEIIYNFGLEYNYSNNFTLRAGFIYDLEGQVKSPTVGAGIKFNNYGFDFGYTAGENDHPRANTMFFSLSIGMGA